MPTTPTPFSAISPDPFWIGPTQTQIINHQIVKDSNNEEQEKEFLTTVISEFNGSQSRQFMDVSQRYYENKSDILNAKRMVLARNLDNTVTMVESKVLSNNKLTHNFMKKLTRQKIGYMLGKPFTLSAVTAEDEKANAMFEAVKDYFDKNFYKMVKNVGRDSIVKGIGWIRVYYDENGNMRFRRVAPEEVIPIWADSDHTELEAIVHPYVVQEYEGGTSKFVKYVEYCTLSGISHYLFDDSGYLVKRPDKEDEFHFYIETPTVDQNNGGAKVERKGVNWSVIPWIPWKYDPDEQSLLTRIKALVDDYDRKTSDIANDIDDIPNSIKVVKNYDGDSIEQFTHNLHQFRSVMVTGDGDLKSVSTPLNISEIDKHLQRLREDIYEFGQGVNTADKDIRDTSGVALRFMYADLDMDCVDWGVEVEWSLMRLIWFIQQDILARTGIDYSDVRYDITFNTDVIINESETITNCMTSNGLISAHTIAENHPWVLDADKEMKNLLQEQGEEFNLEQEYGQMNGTTTAGVT